MKKSYAIVAVALMLSAASCTPTEKKADVPPPPMAPQGEQQSAAPSQAPQAQAAQPAPKSESSTQIVDDYASGLVSNVDRAKKGQAKTDLGAVQDAVRNFQVENGRYPDSLDAIKGFVQVRTDLSAYNYDAGTGTVTLK